MGNPRPQVYPSLTKSIQFPYGMRLSIGILLLYGLFFSKGVSGENISDDSKVSVTEIRAKLEDIARRLESLHYKAPKVDSKFQKLVTPSTNKTQLLHSQDARLDTKEKAPIHLETEEKPDDGLGIKGGGFYILPFVGLQMSNNLEWKSIGGNFDIKEDNGISSGLRLGYEWKNSVLAASLKLSKTRYFFSKINS